MHLPHLPRNASGWVSNGVIDRKLSLGINNRKAYLKINKKNDFSFLQVDINEVYLKF